MKDEDYNKYVRFDHATANSESVPFVTDEKIYTIRDKEQLIASALSSRDKEIREVLEGLVTKRYASFKDCYCWCAPPGDATRREGDKHTPACLATRVLWEKVQS